MNFFQKFWGFIAQPSRSRTMGLVVMLVLVSAVALTVVISQQRQTIKQRAAENLSSLLPPICGDGLDCVATNFGRSCSSEFTDKPNQCLSSKEFLSADVINNNGSVYFLVCCNGPELTLNQDTQPSDFASPCGEGLTCNKTSYEKACFSNPDQPNLCLSDKYFYPGMMPGDSVAVGDVIGGKSLVCCNGSETIPPAPTINDATNITATTADLSWSGTAPYGWSFHLYYMITGGSNLNKIKDLSTTSYQLTGLSPNTSYTWSVSACDTGVTCISSSTGSFTTNANSPPPPPTTDTTPPKVGLIYPTTAKQNIFTTFEVDVSDDVGVAWCALNVNNESVGNMNVPSGCGPSRCTASMDYKFVNAGSYQMRAICGDTSGRTDDFTLGQNTTVTVSETNPPPDDTLSAPTWGKPIEITATSARLQWEATAPADGWYKLNRKIDSDDYPFFDSMSYIATNEILLPNLSPATKYLWYISVCNQDYSTCVDSERWTFTTKSNAAATSTPIPTLTKEPPTPTGNPRLTPPSNRTPTPTSSATNNVTLVMALNVQDAPATSDSISTDAMLYSVTTNSKAAGAPDKVTFNKTPIPGKQYSAEIPLKNLKPDKYFIIVRKDNMIAKSIFTVSGTSNETVTVPTTYLVFGDINNDNAIDILDYNMLKDCWRKNAKDSCSSSNFDNNDVVDQIDYNTWLRGYATWSKEGK